MIAPKIAMFRKVGATPTVRITSAATRNSNPSDNALPKKVLYRAYAFAACRLVCTKKRTDAQRKVPTIRATAIASMPVAPNSINV